MQERGRLTEWNDDRGFGFITPLDGHGRFFVHVSQFPRDLRRPELNDLVSYDASADERGRPQARNVSFLAPTGSRHTPEPRQTSPSAYVIALGFFVLLIALVAAGALSAGAIGLYLVMSVLLFVTYARDKSAAQSGGWRTPEATLHLMALFGGWPGALVAQTTLRHKTRKQPFRTIFYATVVLNCVLLALIVGTSSAFPG